MVKCLYKVIIFRLSPKKDKIKKTIFLKNTKFFSKKYSKKISLLGINLKEIFFYLFWERFEFFGRKRVGKFLGKFLYFFGNDFNIILYKVSEPC